MDHPGIELSAIVSRDFQENCYVVRRPERSDCVVVDPGLDPERIEKYLDNQQLTPAALLLTHGHADHIAGNTHLKRRWPQCPIVIGRADGPKLTDAVQNLSLPFGFEVLSPAADALLDEGDRYSAAGFDFRVLHIPGHSAGHIVYLLEGVEPPLAFVGDVIFSGSIGRTDFPGGDFDTLIAGIQQKLFQLPDETVLYSGHGPATTVGNEKRYNPFARL